VKFTYLLINFITVFFPLILSFDKKVRFYQYWKFIWPGMLITGLVFLFWDVLFIDKGVWTFNSEYITGVTIFKLPIEEILFFLTVPFACIFIYACSNYYIKWVLNIRLTRIVSNLIVIFSILILIFYHHHLYTAVTFGLLGVLVVFFQFIWDARGLGRFYIAYLVSLLPFYMINGLLTGLPVVIYNDAENSGSRIGSIPIEDHFYCMALLLMNIGFFEYFRRRSIKKQHA